MNLLRIPTSNGVLATFQTEPSEKPTLICVHGGPGLNHQSLLPGLLSLANLFSLVFLDLHGHGQSHSQADDYSILSYTRDIYEVVKSLPRKAPMGVLGHSLGGHIAITALASYPEVFDFGILCTTFAKSETWLKYLATTSAELTNPTASEIEANYANSLKNDEDFKKFILAYAPLYFPELSITESSRIMEGWTYKASPYKFAEENFLTTINVEPLCSKINVPCLVVGAEKDKIVSPLEAHTLSQIIPGAKSAIVPGAGHFPFLTYPRLFQTIVSDWYRSAIRL